MSSAVVLKVVWFLPVNRSEWENVLNSAQVRALLSCKCTSEGENLPAFEMKTGVLSWCETQTAFSFTPHPADSDFSTSLFSSEGGFYWNQLPYIHQMIEVGKTPLKITSCLFKRENTISPMMDSEKWKICKVKWSACTRKKLNRMCCSQITASHPVVRLRQEQNTMQIIIV